MSPADGVPGTTAWRHAAGWLALGAVVLLLGQSLFVASGSAGGVSVEISGWYVPAILGLFNLACIGGVALVLIVSGSGPWWRPSAAVLTVAGVLSVPGSVAALATMRWGAEATMSTLLTLGGGLCLVLAGATALTALVRAGTVRRRSPRDVAGALLAAGALLLTATAGRRLVGVLGDDSGTYDLVAQAYGSVYTASYVLAVVAGVALLVLAFAVVDDVRIGVAAAGVLHAAASAPTATVQDASAELADASGQLTGITLGMSVAWTDLLAAASFAAALAVLLGRVWPLRRP